MMEWGGATTQPGQIVDGLSLVDYLEHGTPLGRDAIFCHFPHYVNFVISEQNLPATSVRRGDYKLIRFYGEGPNQTNAYELYDLAGDIGETTNLADSMPALVAELDALITQHLEDTGAIVPFPNPAYSEPVGGWRALNNMLLSQDGGMLRTRMLGIGPYMECAEAIDLSGPIRVHMRLRIQGEEQIRLFWTTPALAYYEAARRENFDVPHDGTWVELQSAPITDDVVRIRIDAGSGAGASDFDWVRVYDETETQLLAEWDFGGAWDGSPFVPYSPYAGWSADYDCTLTDYPGHTRVNITGATPFMSSRAFASHPGPVKVELRLRSRPENAGVPTRLMWANSEGGFGVVHGRGMAFDQIHDGDWHVYTHDVNTPDVHQLRLDPLTGTFAGAVVEIDWIRLLTADGSTVLEQWDFGLELETQSRPEAWADYR